jgi:hypothetical protein
MALTQVSSGLISSVANTAITGNIISSQITSVANTQITGNITSSQIASTSVTSGNYGGSSAIPVITVGACGRITSAANASFSAGGTKSWYFYTSSNTFTVPSGTTSIRAYAFGRGGNGGRGDGGTNPGTGGGGGGAAYGDIAVTAGSTVSISISSGIATVSYSCTTMLTANPGSNGHSCPSLGALGGAGGTASKHASVTNGGAYSGGAGGRVANASNSNAAGGGGSSGSPLGVGLSPNSAYNNCASGGAGWVSQNSGTGGGSGGGSAGGSGAIFSSSGGGNYFQPTTRCFSQQYTDPLLVAMNLTGKGGSGSIGIQLPQGTYFTVAQNGESGGGGGGISSTSTNQVTSHTAGAGGNGGGGGGVVIGKYNPGSWIAGNGGFGGGGGGITLINNASSSGNYLYGADGGYAGGGGGVAGTYACSINKCGTGGAAIVVIYG